MKYSIIIPAYNEEKRIKSVIEKLTKAFNDHEIIVVDDGSTDKTFDSALSTGVKVLKHDKNTGKGEAIKTGFLKASGDVIGFVDADEAVEIESMKNIFAKAETEGIIAIASRRHPHAHIIIKQPIPRRFASKIFNLLVRLLFRLNISDTQCGCKAFPQIVAKELAREAKCNGFEIDVELLWLAKKKGLKIVEIPINWRHESGSSFSLMEGPKMVISLIKLRLGLT